MNEQTGQEGNENGGDVPVETVAVTDAVSDAVSLMEKEAKKRKAEDYSHASTAHWKQHFIVLEEFHYSLSGKKGHRLGFCKHCKQASEDPTVEQCATITRVNYGNAPKPPAKMQIYNRNCQTHLGKCK